MIEKKLKTTNGWLVLTIPTLISEVTLGQLISLREPFVTDIESIGILSGTSLDDLYSVRVIEDFNIFKPVLIDLNKQMASSFDGDIPKRVTLKIDGSNKKVDVIRNLSVEPVGAYLAVSELIEGEQEKARVADPEGWKEKLFEPSLKMILNILAHYFYCPATGKDYTEKDALSFTEVVKDIPCTQALPIAKYFFLNYPHLTKQKSSFWKAAPQYLKLKRELKNLGSSEE